MQVSDEARSAAKVFVTRYGWLVESSWDTIHPADQLVIAQAFQSAIDAARADERAKALREAAEVALSYRYGDSMLDSCTMRRDQRERIAAAILKLENPDVE